MRYFGEVPGTKYLVLEYATEEYRRYVVRRSLPFFVPPPPQRSRSRLSRPPRRSRTAGLCCSARSGLADPIISSQSGFGYYTGFAGPPASSRFHQLYIVTKLNPRTGRAVPTVHAQQWHSSARAYYFSTISRHTPRRT